MVLDALPGQLGAGSTPNSLEAGSGFWCYKGDTGAGISLRCVQESRRGACLGQVWFFLPQCPWRRAFDRAANGKQTATFILVIKNVWLGDFDGAVGPLAAAEPQATESALLALQNEELLAQALPALTRATLTGL